MKYKGGGLRLQLLHGNIQHKERTEQGLQKSSRKQSDPGIIFLLIQVESRQSILNVREFQKCCSQEALSRRLKGNFRWWKNTAKELVMSMDPVYLGD